MTMNADNAAHRPWAMTREQVDVYLTRLDVNVKDQGIPAATWKTLTYLTRKHLENIPFENVDMHLGPRVKSGSAPPLSLDLDKIADKLLLEESRGDPNETLTEAEFLVSVLKEHGIVDDTTLATIRAEFRELVGFSAASQGAIETRVLDSKAVFIQLCSDGRIEQRGKGVAVGAVVDGKALVDLRAFDKGYGEWYKHHWVKQVAANAPKTVLSNPEPKPSVFSDVFGFLNCTAPRKPMQQELV